MPEPPGLAAPRAVPQTRRAARALREEDERRAREEHAEASARDRRFVRLARPGAVVAAVGAAAAVVVGAAVVASSLLGGAARSGDRPDAVLSIAEAPPAAQTLPVPEITAVPPDPDLCAIPAFADALQSGDDQAAIAAAGGGEEFRAAVVGGRAPCVDLGDSSRVWTVLDKHRPANPIDYRPAGLMLPEGVRDIEGGALRADAAAAMTAMVAAAHDAGVGEVAVESAFRSYQTQQATYGRHYAERGAAADQVSARPGFSEHQLGLSADVVACSGGCGDLDGLAASPQGQWIAAHAWEHGWIVRYVEGATPVTGYTPEPWHLRYVGPALAKAYHDGGWTSLEEFFGLEAAPDYPG